MSMSVFHIHRVLIYAVAVCVSTISIFYYSLNVPAETTMLNIASALETAVTDIGLEPEPTQMEIFSDDGALILISYYEAPWTGSYSEQTGEICSGCSIVVNIADSNLPFEFTGLAIILSDNPIDVVVLAGPGEVLVADFEANPVIGEPLTVDFTTNASCTFCSFEWSFGDGNSSTERSPQHTYAASGSYFVEHTVYVPIENYGDYRLGKYVSVPVIPLSAEFSGVPLAGAPPLDVAFSAEITGTYESLLWEFGDGNSSIVLNPTHTYTYQGDYTVTLTVYEEPDDVAPIVMSKVDYISVEPTVYLPVVVR